ncbi:MAG: thermonuclease family protein [Cyanobacteria bacterium P01_C01_bin.72]
MKIRTLVVCCCLLFLLGCGRTSEVKSLFAGEVTRVLSGQTVEIVLTGKSDVLRLRLIGVDAPDWRQSPWGEAAKQKLADLVWGKAISIEAESLESDRYNRIQGHLWLDQTLVSQQLVESGCVLANDRYPHSYSKLLMESQEYARLMGLGIWNPQQAMRYTPSQFRSMNK